MKIFCVFVYGSDPGGTSERSIGGCSLEALWKEQVVAGPLQQPVGGRADSRSDRVRRRALTKRV